MENSNGRLEDMCVDLELTIEKVQNWNNQHAPSTEQPTESAENTDEE